MWRVRDEARLLTSEFALHARTALDYVVFALALRDTKTEQKGTQFPINKTPVDFAQNRTGCLRHLTDEHVAMIEDFQPYKGFRHRPLSVLHDLSNRDKHREYALITYGGMKSPYRTFDVLLYEGESEELVKVLDNIRSQVSEVVDYFDRVLG